MKRFLLHIIIFLAFVCVIDIAFGYAMRTACSKVKVGEWGVNNYIINEVDKDVLIFGSSRAIHHINPSILEDSLGLSCFNCGQDGRGIIFNYARLALVFQRYAPKAIIYEVLPKFDILEYDAKGDITALKPYYGHDVIKKVFARYDATEKYKMLSGLYRYNTCFLDILNQSRYDAPLASEFKYAPLQAVMQQEPLSIQRYDGWQIDAQKLSYMRKLIEMCKRHNTKLIFTISPWYGRKDDVEYETIKQLVREADVPLLNHFTDIRFQDKSLFAEQAHLNETGATVYSNVMAHELRQLIQ